MTYENPTRVTQNRRLAASFGIMLVVALPAMCAGAGDVDWKILKPTNTGVPGELVHFAEFGPDGRLWVSARWPFWNEGGIGVYDLVTKGWTNYANWETPLPSSKVNDVAFAPGGVVWFATDGGLARLVGETWTVFTTANSPLNHNGIRNLAVDSEGDLWINNSDSTNSPSALFEYDGQTWRSFSVPGDLPWSAPWTDLSHVVVDANDHVWVGNSVQSGVARYDGESWTLLGDNIIGSVQKIAVDLEGNIWLNSVYLYKYDGANFTPYPEVGSSDSLAIGADGKVWVGSNGLIVFTPDSGESWFLYALVTAQLQSVAPDPNSGDVWAASIGAVRHHDASGDWVEALNTYNSGLPHYFTETVATGRDGHMLVTSGEAGVSRWDADSWFNLGSHNPNNPWLPLADGASGAYEDSHGNLWVGTNGILRWDGETSTYWHIILTFRMFGEDVHGVLWAGGGASLYRFENENWVLHSITSPLREIVTDHAGNMWVVGQMELRRWDGEVWTTWNAGNTPNWTWSENTSIAIDPQDQVWLGTDVGLVRFDGTTNTRYHTGNSPLPALQIQGVDIRPDGMLGLSCHEFGAATPFPNGVVIIDGDIDNPSDWTVHTYENSPLPHYQLGPAAFDATGRLWVVAMTEGVATLLPRPLANGDADGDGDVDVFDFAAYLGCITGPAGGVPEGCEAFDLDFDDDVDLADVGALQVLFTGAP